MRLVANIATRGRPELLRAGIFQALANATLPDTVLMVSVDEDDESTVEMLNNLPIAASRRTIISIKPREDTIAAKWNRAIVRVPDAGVYVPMCDDSHVVTPGWDALLIKAAESVPDRIVFLYSRLVNPSFPGFQAVTRRVVDLMGGQIYVEHFPYWFVDHWLDDIARMVDRIFCVPINLNVSSYSGTQEMREPGWWADFFDACWEERLLTARILIRECTHDAPWRRNMTRSRVEMVQSRSRWINDCVRTIANPTLATDDRYDRVKHAAVEMLRDRILPMMRKQNGAA
jgi:hypothetical protein